MATTQDDLDEFTRAYIEAALWSSIDDNDEPLNLKYDIEDIDQETLEKMVADCKVFQAKNAAHISEKNLTKPLECTAEAYAGHDFWLTRNGHGCGFWDGNWKRRAACAMEAYCDKMGTVDLYVGDDKKVYSY